MCVQYHGGGGGDSLLCGHGGGYLEYCGGCSVPGGYLEYRRGCSVPVDIMSTVGCSVPWGISSFAVFEYCGAGG